MASWGSHPAAPLLAQPPPGDSRDHLVTPLSEPTKANPPPAPSHALEAGQEELIATSQTLSPFLPSLP